MKVFLISNMYPSSSYPVFGGFVQNQVEELKKREIQFTLAVNRVKKGGYISLWKYLLLFIRIIRASFSNFDLIHAHYLFPTGFLALFPHFARRKPLIVTTHGSDINFGKKSGLFCFLIKLVCRRASAVIFVSEYLAKEAEHLYSILPEKLSVINCGVNTEVFCPQDKIVLRKKIGLPSDKKIILFVGNLVKVKGVNFLLEAFPDILSREPDVLAVVIGEGEEKSGLETLAKDLGIEEFVRFEKFKSHLEVASWISASDVFVLPSLKEGFGLVALEALSSGVPVVASRTGGLPEFVKDGENGFLVEPGDPSKIAEKVEVLLKDDKEYTNISKKARESAFLHDVELQTKRIVELYCKIVCKRKKAEAF